MKFLAMHITDQKLRFDRFKVVNVQNIAMKLNILIIFGIKEKSIILTQTVYFGYCYEYTRATYDWFCAPGLHNNNHKWSDL